MPQPLIVNCSPRQGGNSAYAADSIAKKLADAVPPQGALTVLSLCDYTITPCIGCDICASPKSHRRFFLGCPLAPQDESEHVITALLQASSLYFVSPIYHYHLPAQAKALLDRLQPFFWMQQQKAPYPSLLTPHIRYFPLFVAGQAQGKKLFEGSLLSLRYSFQSLGWQQGNWLGLRSIDEKDALRHNTEAQKNIEEYLMQSLTPPEPVTSAFGPHGSL